MDSHHQPLWPPYSPLPPLVIRRHKPILPTTLMICFIVGRKTKVDDMKRTRISAMMMSAKSISANITTTPPNTYGSNNFHEKNVVPLPV